MGPVLNPPGFLLLEFCLSTGVTLAPPGVSSVPAGEELPSCMSGEDCGGVTEAEPVPPVLPVSAGVCWPEPPEDWEAIFTVNVRS